MVDSGMIMMPLVNTMDQEDELSQEDSSFYNERALRSAHSIHTEMLMKARDTELRNMPFGVSIFGLEFVHFRQIYLRTLVLVFKTGIIVMPT